MPAPYASAEKRAELVAAATQLLHEQGFHRTTLADVAGRADVPLGNVYYYFKTKDAIAEAVISAHEGALRALFASWTSKHAAPHERLRCFVRAPLDASDRVIQFGCPHGSLCQELEKLGAKARVMSAIKINDVCEDYIRRRAIRHLEKGRLVIFAAGVGSPFFTTDSGAALRAIEIGADLLLKATKVDGVYSDDPVRNPSAQRYTQLTFDKVLQDRLNVMDATAIVMCRDNRLPLRVFNLNNPGDLTRIARGEEIGTAVTFE